MWRARVVSDQPVQVDILTGDIGSNYESRDSASAADQLVGEQLLHAGLDPD